MLNGSHIPLTEEVTIAWGGFVTLKENMYQRPAKSISSSIIPSKSDHTKFDVIGDHLFELI